MKRRRFLKSGASLAGCLAMATTFGQPAMASEPTCGEYGTTVEFAASPAEAAKRALKEEKLVFVLHVSGLFEEPNYT